MSECIPIKDGWLTLARINFECPNCGNQYQDKDDKYLDKVNKNRSGYTRINCDRCSERFGITYDITGDAVGFTL